MEISLKNHSIDKIQQTIATALSDLCGETVDVYISSFVEKEDMLRWVVKIDAAISHKWTFEQMQKESLWLKPYGITDEEESPHKSEASKRT